MTGRRRDRNESKSPLDRRAVAGWVLYDWANSAFTTIVVTFLYSTYFTQVIAPNELDGTTLWSRAVSVSAVLVAVLAPVVGALADQRAAARRYLAVATGISCAATAGLAAIGPEDPSAVGLALVTFVVANVAFELGGVLYNGFLPRLAPPDRIGTVSGLGWGMGYTGSILSLAIALFAFVGLGESDPWIPLPEDGGFHVRAVNLWVAGWYLLFSLPFFLWVPEVAPAAETAPLRSTFRRLAHTARSLRTFRTAFRFFIARLLYNDGLVTIFAFGGIYAAGTFGMDFGDVLLFGIVLNAVAGAGAILFGRVDDRFGGKRTVMISLAGLTAATLLAAIGPSVAWFWVAGLVVGVFAGPNQAASRSLLGRFAPEGRESEFFGFFALSGKLTSFAGPALLGGVTAFAGSQRAGVASVVLFLLGGAILLATVDEADGIRAAQEAA